MEKCEKTKKQNQNFGQIEKPEKSSGLHFWSNLQQKIIWKDENQAFGPRHETKTWKISWSTAPQQHHGRKNKKHCNYSVLQFLCPRGTFWHYQAIDFELSVRNFFAGFGAILVASQTTSFGFAPFQRFCNFTILSLFLSNFNFVIIFFDLFLIFS